MCAEDCGLGAPAANGQCVGIGLGGGHPDNFRVQSERIACCDQAADAGSHTDADVDGIETLSGTEQFQRVTGNARDQVAVERIHEMQPLGGRDAAGFVPGFVEITSELHDFCAERGDGGILIGRVAVRDVDRGGDLGTRCGERQGLAMIAARRGYDAAEMRLLAQ